MVQRLQTRRVDIHPQWCFRSSSGTASGRAGFIRADVIYAGVTVPQLADIRLLQFGLLLLDSRWAAEFFLCCMERFCLKCNVCLLGMQVRWLIVVKVSSC